jgi:hypothetical protein
MLPAAASDRGHERNGVAEAFPFACSPQGSTQGTPRDSLTYLHARRTLGIWSNARKPKMRERKGRARKQIWTHKPDVKKRLKHGTEPELMQYLGEIEIFGRRPWRGTTKRLRDYLRDEIGCFVEL